MRRGEHHRIDADIKFLAWLGSASFDDLVARARQYADTNGCPQWKVVAVQRAIEKRIASTESGGSRTNGENRQWK
jgi:hypothetical protein